MEKAMSATEALSETSNLRYTIKDIVNFREKGEHLELETYDEIYTLPASYKKNILELKETLPIKVFNPNDITEKSLEILPQLKKTGLVVSLRDSNSSMPGTEFYKECFSKNIDRWIDNAFSHSAWQEMMNGTADVNVFIGWLFELFHYTKNANRHMPLSVAHCADKRIKTLFAVHFKEEWNHYHFFRRALEAYGFSREEVENSDPLPMTEQMSNLMREAARKDVLCYAICSALLEGTTIDNESYDNFYEIVREKYSLPKGTIKPIYEHLELDEKYGHADLFLEICEGIQSISVERAEEAVKYASLMSENILAWSENISDYYSNKFSEIPRVKADIFDA